MLPRERAAHYRAFEAGVPACESLGACHLLAHSVWAFKTSAEGERTDLVLGYHSTSQTKSGALYKSSFSPNGNAVPTNPLILLRAHGRASDATIQRGRFPRGSLHRPCFPFRPRQVRRFAPRGSAPGKFSLG